MTIEEEVALLNEELKGVRNLEQLNTLLHKAGSESEHGPHRLEGKRRGYWAFSFSDYPPNPAKTHYLYSDGISTGVSQYKNLYMILHFKVYKGI